VTKKGGHECYHCKQWVAEGEAHDCWTTTEAALTRDLSDDLQDAYARLRETAAEFGEQRIYASHKCIMFSRKTCYFFVRPKKSHLELCVFLGRPIKAPQVRRVERPSKTKVANLIRVTHRDEIEAPVTDWLREAYDYGQPDAKVPPVPPAKSAGTAGRRADPVRPAKARRPAKAKRVSARPQSARARKPRDRR
jgi:hypothetical protein